jgi:hypothetical protein
MKDACIPRGCASAVLLLQEHKPLIAPLKVADNSCRIVGRSVVNDNNLDGTVGLTKRRGDRFGKKALGVVGRNDYGY